MCAPSTCCTKHTLGHEMQVVVFRYTAARMLSQRMARRVASPHTFVSSWAMHLRAHEGHCYHRGDTSKTCAASLRSRPGTVRTSPPSWSRMSPRRRRRRGHTGDRMLLARIRHGDLRLGHTWAMAHRTITCTGGLSRTLQTCHLPGKIFGASRSIWTGFFLTRKRSQELSAALRPGSDTPVTRGTGLTLPSSDRVADYSR